jgi:hypothetical protein
LRMNADEAADIAGATARRLNLPWSNDVRVSRLWRLWPFARRWRVVSRVPAELAETTILVNEATRLGQPVRVRHSRAFGAREV